MELHPHFPLCFFGVWRDIIRVFDTHNSRGPQITVLSITRVPANYARSDVLKLV
jgi:hypothetical protein